MRYRDITTKLAHRWKKKQQEVFKFDTVYDGPTNVADDLQDTWQGIWTANRAPPISWITQHSALDPIDVPHCRNVLRYFNDYTAIGSDHTHPTELDSLSDNALSALICFFYACERIGNWPIALLHIFIAMIPKPSDKGGGFRPIGIATSLYRVYCRLRMQYAVK